MKEEEEKRKVKGENKNVKEEKKSLRRKAKQKPKAPGALACPGWTPCPGTLGAREGAGASRVQRLSWCQSKMQWCIQ